MNFLLNKGGAGKSLSRAETASQTSKLMIGHIGLLHAYGALLEAMGPENDAAESIRVLQKEHRNEIPKLSEIILSSGATPPREADPPEGEDVESLLREIEDGERAMRTSLEEQLKLKHHIRTLAVLNTLLANTERRIGEVRSVARQLNVLVS